MRLAPRARLWTTLCLGTALAAAPLAAQEMPLSLSSKPGRSGASSPPAFQLRTEAPTATIVPQGGAAALKAPPAKAATKAVAPDSADLSALRYYASQGDTARLSAEIRNLRLLYPNWEPPEDLYETGGSTRDEQPLWDLFAAGRLDEVQDSIAAAQAEQPDWRPSAEFQRKYAAALARRDLVRASDAGQWGVVLSVAEARGDLLVCGDVDVLWRVAEALARSDDAERALDAYRYILTTCKLGPERLATVQKAATLLPSPMVATLISLGRRKADGTGEFDDVRYDALRRKVGEAARGDAGNLSPAEVETLEKRAAQTRSPDDLQLLGWYHYARKDFDAARDRFAQALAARKDAKSAEGLTLSLKAAGRFAEAEEVGYANRQSDALVRKAYIETVSAAITATPPAPLSPERRARFAEIVAAEKSALGAQSLGWSLYGEKDLKAALGWFKSSVEWQATEEGVIGLVLTARRLGDPAGEAAMKAYKAAYPRLASLDRIGSDAPRAQRSAARKTGPADQLAVRAVAEYKANNYAGAIALLDQRRAVAAEPRDLALLRGWAYYNSGDLTRAKTVFRDLDAVSRTKESQEGLGVVSTMELNPRMR
ncbi:MAG: hypothetical protein U1E62_07970 [Alsobacter sp.]